MSFNPNPSVIYNAFLRANYFFVSTDSGFGRGDFYKRVVGLGDVFHRDKVTGECRAGQLAGALGLRIKAGAMVGEAVFRQDAFDRALGGQRQ
jgi:hypothetical protein